MTAIALGPPIARREQLTRRIRRLVAATITWNLLEAATAMTAGTLASSTALTGFGLDSIAEVTSAAAVAWQFSAPSPAARQTRETTALRVTAVSFFVLAAYITATSIRALTGDGPARHSLPGIALAAASLLVMPLLSAAQRRAGRELGSASAVADSKQTLLCTCLSAVLLAGLLANAVLGWRWADPLAALVIAAAAAREGRNAWRGDPCCANPATTQLTPEASGSDCHIGRPGLPADAGGPAGSAPGC
jgi:divalent metal cation (Fe/Co/Zn/Cd) transporter